MSTSCPRLLLAVTAVRILLHKLCCKWRAAPPSAPRPPSRAPARPPSPRARRRRAAAGDVLTMRSCAQSSGARCACCASAWTARARRACSATPALAPPIASPPSPPPGSTSTLSPCAIGNCSCGTSEVCSGDRSEIGARSGRDLTVSTSRTALRRAPSPPNPRRAGSVGVRAFWHKYATAATAALVWVVDATDT